jgi:two-component system, OmpR family, response regulator CpxR
MWAEQRNAASCVRFACSNWPSAESPSANAVPGKSAQGYAVEAAERCVFQRAAIIFLFQGVDRFPMRPKKIILCVIGNEQDLSVLAFMLSTNGYRVLSTGDSQEAIALFADNLVDLVLADGSAPHLNGNQLVGKLKQIAAHIPMILLADPQKIDGQGHSADALLAKKTCSSFELLERIKVMSARKRGPRKGMTRLAQGAALAVAS